MSDRQDVAALICVVAIGAGLALIHPGLLIAALGVVGLVRVVSPPDEEAG